MTVNSYFDQHVVHLVTVCFFFFILLNYPLLWNLLTSIHKKNCLESNKYWRYKEKYIVDCLSFLVRKLFRDDLSMSLKKKKTPGAWKFLAECQILLIREEWKQLQRKCMKFHPESVVFFSLRKYSIEEFGRYKPKQQRINGKVFNLSFSVLTT